MGLRFMVVYAPNNIFINNERKLNETNLCRPFSSTVQIVYHRIVLSLDQLFVFQIN